MAKLNIIGNIQDSLNTLSGVNRKFFFNRGDYDAKRELWNADLLEIISSLTIVGSPLIDKDGNVYTTVIIGSQEWIIQNLKVTKYADGSAIPNLPVDEDWITDPNGAYCWYNNGIINKEPYGALYNWYAITNAKGLAYFERSGYQEIDWRIPTESDWIKLITTLGGSDYGGGKLKEAGVTHWNDPNTGADNLSGFTALPAGDRDETGAFTNLLNYAQFWTSDAWAVTLSYNEQGIVINDAGTFKMIGRSVRCVRDVTPVTPPDETTSLDPTSLLWAFDEIDTKVIEVTTDMARWYFGADSVYGDFTVTVWDSTNTTEITDGVYLTGYIIRVTPTGENSGDISNVCHLSIANAEDITRASIICSQTPEEVAPYANAQNTNIPSPPFGYTVVFPALFTAATPVCSSMATVEQALGTDYSFYVFAKGIYGSETRIVDIISTDIILTLNGVRTVLAPGVAISHLSGYLCAGTLVDSGTWNSGDVGVVTFENAIIASNPGYTLCG